MQTHVFGRAHFTVIVDPMRVVTVPNTVNAKTGLICRFLGSPKDLEILTISEVLEMSKTFPVHGHLEALENSSVSCNGPMKSCAKKLAEATWQR
jgi:hypothetical protein